MKYFSLDSGLSYTLRFCEPVFYDMTIGKETFELSQDYDTLTKDNFYKLKHFLLIEEPSKISCLYLDLDSEISMKIEDLVNGYLATFDDEDDHYEFQIDMAFFRDYLLMIQEIENYMKKHTGIAYKSNYDEISDLLKTISKE